MKSIDMDLVDPLLKVAGTARERETAPLRGHGLAEWLLSHHFPSRMRKSSTPPVLVTSPSRGRIRVQLAKRGEGGEEDGWDGSEWEKAARNALKKVVVEDLGNMNATELESSIPELDSEGRGMSDLRSLEKKMSVKVVFDAATGHVLLVGDAKKLDRKVFVIRNMLSHYHWRLSGTDLALDRATASPR